MSNQPQGYIYQTHNNNKHPAELHGTQDLQTHLNLLKKICFFYFFRILAQLAHFLQNNNNGASLGLGLLDKRQALLLDHEGQWLLLHIEWILGIGEQFLECSFDLSIFHLLDHLQSLPDHIGETFPILHELQPYVDLLTTLYFLLFALMSRYSCGNAVVHLLELASEFFGDVVVHGVGSSVESMDNAMQIDGSFSFEEEEDGAAVGQCPSLSDELPHLPQQLAVDGQDLRLLQSLHQAYQRGFSNSLDGQFQSISFSLGFLQTLIVKILIQFLLLLFFLQFLLMVIPGDIRAVVIIAMSLPDLEADPAKLILAATGHMDAAVVLLY